MRTRKRPVGVLVSTLVGALVAVAFATSVHGSGGPASASGRAMPTNEPWDLVWISESSGWGVAPFYARHIRQDLGVAVRVHDEWEGNLMAVDILSRLRTQGDPWIRLIRDAEVIVVKGGPLGLSIETVERGDCVVAGCQRPLAVGPRTWQRYVATLKAIYAQIFEIRKGKPVVLRTTNWYVPIIGHAPSTPGFATASLKQCGLVGVCTRWYESWSAAISKASAAYHVRMADVYKAFNGPTHMEDPVAKGYIQADGIHPNDKGRAVEARTVAALGYKHVNAPR